MTRGLVGHPPTQAELERLYYELARVGAPSVGRRRPWAYRPRTREDLVALAGEMLRYDPRLLTILLQLFLTRWDALNPVTVRRRMAEMRWPQALLVALAFVRLAASDPELKRFVDYLSAGWRPVQAAERFFFGADRPGSRLAARNLGRNLAPYARWGFIGTERPVADLATKRTVGAYDRQTRRQILRALASSRGEFGLADYLEAVDRSITRQQALSDLRSLTGLEPVGHGRGARWHRRR